MERRWDPKSAPPLDVCPRQFCWFFSAAGSRIAPGLHNDLDAARAALQRVTVDACSCFAGRCTRLGDGEGDRDWYEPNEAALQSAGLPWTFFERPK